MQLHRERESIERRGAQLVMVGNGSRRLAQAFRDELGLETPIYLDPERGAYRALGMRRGHLRTLGPSSLRHAWRALRSGARQKGVQGDPWQLGGVLVVLPDGRVPYRYVSETAGDHPWVAEILAALPGAKG